MLHEPEQWVGDRVVVPVVDQSRRIDPAHLEPRTVGGLHHHRLATVSEFELAQKTVTYRGDPDGPRRLGQSGEPGHEPARAAHEALAVGRILRDVDRRPVGGHDRVEVLEKAPGVLLDRQHRSRLTLRGHLRIAPPAGPYRLHASLICDIVNIKLPARQAWARGALKG